MNSKQFQELQEAYMNVYQEIDEAKVDLEVSTEEVDVYDVILSHLLDEGYADTEQAATAIMVNMSEVWRDSVVEAYKELPVGKMIRKVGTKQFKHGMSVGSGASSNPKVPAQVGKMSAIASLHDPERAQSKSKMKKG